MTACRCGRGEAGKFTSVHHMAPGCDLVGDDTRAAIVADALRNLPVRGYCPMGCGATLICGRPDGAVLCSSTGCPRPSAAGELLDDRETEHIVELHEDDFTIRHPLRERLDDELMTCDIHAQLRATDGPPRPPGRYRLTVRGRIWSWAEVPA